LLYCNMEAELLMILLLSLLEPDEAWHVQSTHFYDAKHMWKLHWREELSLLGSVVRTKLLEYNQCRGALCPK